LGILAYFSQLKAILSAAIVSYYVEYSNYPKDEWGFEPGTGYGLNLQNLG